MNCGKSQAQHITCLYPLPFFFLHCLFPAFILLSLLVWFPVPGAPPRKLEVEAINSTAIRVTWKPPLQVKQHGQIRGYQVIFSRLENGEPRGQPNIMDVALPEAQVQDDVLLVSSLSASCLFLFHCLCVFILHRFSIPSHRLSSHFISSVPGDTDGICSTRPPSNLSHIWHLTLNWNPAPTALD